MRLTTPVHITPVQATIDYSDKILLLGSCFADNVGEKLQHHYFQTTINPFGTLYNPVSIAEAIRLAKADAIECLPMVEWGGLWHSMTHHGVCSNANKGIAFQQCMASIANLRQALREASVIVITFGTAWIYEYSTQFPNVDNFSTKVVANCHKMPANWFVRRRLSVEEIVSVWQPLINSMPEKHWIFTVSPIRHIKDGLHENQLSKSILLQAVDSLAAKRSSDMTFNEPLISYFPAYEIMIDELRDYRFYADDMIHLSSKAVEYIWECFCQCYFSKETQMVMKEWTEIKKAIDHKPFRPDSDAYRAFLSQIVLKIMQMKEKFPYLEVQKEMELCESRLKM